jgi:hypothetical protein
MMGFTVPDQTDLSLFGLPCENGYRCRILMPKIQDLVPPHVIVQGVHLLLHGWSPRSSDRNPTGRESLIPSMSKSVTKPFGLVSGSDSILIFGDLVEDLCRCLVGHFCPPGPAILV